MKIIIYGLGYVGLTAAGCLTEAGHDVLGVDVNAHKVDLVNAGKSPISEPGLDVLLAKACLNGRLRATLDPGRSINEFDIAFVCVGTPSASDGSHNMTYMAEVSRQIAAAIDPSQRKEPLTVVYRSTIRPGTLDEFVLPIFRSYLKNQIGAIELIYNPEFLRESVAIRDYFNPPKIVIGTADGQISAKMNVLYAGLDAPTFYTRFREAELTKFVDNSFHALKVAFANEIGRICLQIGVSTEIIHEIFVSDTKLNISPYYLRPGGAFGGSCLPKDVRALQFISGDVGAQTYLIDSLLRSNDAHKHYLYNYCIRDVPQGSHVLLIGLAFKANSDDLRESPNLDLARRLLQGGFSVSVYDPVLRPDMLVGQNLGNAYAQLPMLDELLIDKETAEKNQFDLVIDTNGSAKSLALCSSRIVSINQLS
ncbi:nucleotide sugar dehydrogenase [Xanthobacter autotrophicus]|uniref:nucleotide sugar dehydrogenase n=1 Tax=Xanthobacter autotrophicus TaxID=280 RepID=UPI0037295400